MLWILIIVLVWVLQPSMTLLALPANNNGEVVTLMTVKAKLKDNEGYLYDWFLNDDDSCYWVGVECSDGKHVSKPSLMSMRLSGNLSPQIGNLSSLRFLFVQSNSISGTISPSIGRLTNLLAVDMSVNQFTGSIPNSVGDLKSLYSLKLNDNSLSGIIPYSLGNIAGLEIDLSFNNLSGPLPNIYICSIFNILGNPLICGVSEDNCPSVRPDIPKTAAAAQIRHGMSRRQRMILIIVICVAPAVVFVY